MRRGFIYTIDAAIAILLLVIALVALFGSYVYAPKSDAVNAMGSDVLQLLSQTRMSDLCSATCSCAYDSLVPLCRLPSFDRNATLLGVIGQAHARGDDQLATAAVGDVIRGSGAVPKSLGVQVVLTDGSQRILVYGDQP